MLKTISLAALLGLLASCSLLGGASIAQAEWERASADGNIDEREAGRMDAALETDVQRENGWADELTDYAAQLGTIGGPVGLLTGLAVNMLRNRRRRQRGEPVSTNAAQQLPGGAT